jgi:hypothetical protein
MKVSKVKLHQIIENFLFESKDAKEKKSFKIDEEIKLPDGLTFEFKSSDDGGVTVVETGPEGEFKYSLSQDQVEGESKEKENFVVNVAGILMAISRDKGKNTVKDVLKKLSPFIDLSPALTRPVLVKYDQKHIKNTSSSRIT